MFEKQSICQDRVIFMLILASISLVFFSAFSSYSSWHKCPVSNNDIKSYVSYGEEEQEETNISHIVFGIAGSMETWKKRIEYSLLWWKPNITRGFIWLDQKPMENYTWPENTPPYRVSEEILPQHLPHHGSSGIQVRITRILLETYRLGFENVRWFVFGDDDTMVFTDNLVSVLSKYDHNQMYYIGANSESVQQATTISYMAFGGGGLAISYPLAAELANILDDCLVRYSWTTFADEKTADCTKEIGVPLTEELGFHQVTTADALCILQGTSVMEDCTPAWLDITGDPYGLLAAHPVTPLVTMHHIDVVDSLFPTRTQLDSLRTLMGAYKEDPGRILQQTFCHDFQRKWSISVSWGYTAQIYPRLMTAKDLGTALQTFRNWGYGAFTFNTRQLGPDPCDRPIIYFLDQVDGAKDGNTHTSYMRFETSPEKMCNRTDYIPVLAVHHVNVSAMKMEPREWKKAPRRQCCRIMNSVDGVVNIEIRRCNLWETVTLLP